MAYVFLVLAQVSVGVNIVGSKYLLPHMSVIALLVARFWLAGILLFACHGFLPRSKQPLAQLTKRDFVFLILQALFAGALFNLLLLAGLQYASASVAGVITAALPAMITIFSVLLLKERLSLYGVACVLLAVVGLIIVNAHGIGGSSGAGLHHTQLKGVLILLLALLPESLYYVLCKMHRVNMPLFLLSAWINVINGIVILPVLLFHHSALLVSLSGSLMVVLLLVCGSSALFYVCWYLGCRQVSGSVAGLFTAVMPIATLVLSWLFLSEGLSVLQMVGLLLVITSIIMYARGHARGRQ